MKLADMIIPRPLEQQNRYDLVCDLEKINWIIAENKDEYDLSIAAAWINKTLEELDVRPLVFQTSVKNFSPRRKIVLSKHTALEPEEYHLTVTNESVKVEGGSRAGILHGVRSLCQVMACSAEYGGLDRGIPVGCVCDKPRFAYRGLMLDSGRHFQKKEVILTLLEEMSRYKLNTFHWHISDRQGWRLPLKSFPELTKEMPHSRCYSHGIYSREDIREIRRYAKEREIEIIPEIEMPGHSGAVFLTHPELACPVSDDPFADDFWEYCLGNPRSASFLRKILKETTELFPESRIIHIGGDEASPLHWEQCPLCRKKMKSLKLKNVRELESWFMAEREKDIAGLGLRAMTWGKHEGSYERFSGNMILQNWLEKDVSKLVVTGLEIVNSYHPEMYFDYPATDHGEDIRKWQERCYGFDAAAGVKSGQRKQIIGGEGCVWTEQLPQWRVPARVLPRLRALAEALWTDPAKKDFEDFLSRENILCGSGLFRYR